MQCISLQQSTRLSPSSLASLSPSDHHGRINYFLLKVLKVALCTLSSKPVTCCRCVTSVSERLNKTSYMHINHVSIWSTCKVQDNNLTFWDFFLCLTSCVARKREGLSTWDPDCFVKMITLLSPLHFFFYILITHADTDYSCRPCCKLLCINKLHCTQKCLDYFDQ